MQWFSQRNQWFQHTAARRRLGIFINIKTKPFSFNTQPPEGGWKTYSADFANSQSFNTQPPEGGWVSGLSGTVSQASFNTQPPEGGW